MRIVKKGGATPCDRRLDRRKVAIAAVAAVCLFATSVQASTFQIDTSLSFLQNKLTFNDASDTAGFDLVFSGLNKALSPFNSGPLAALASTWPAITNRTPASGTIDATITPGTSIVFGAGSSINYGLTGTYLGVAPFAPAPIGTPAPGQIGWGGILSVSPGSYAAAAVINGLATTFNAGAQADFSGGISYPFPVDYSFTNGMVATGGLATINIFLSGGSISTIDLVNDVNGGPLQIPLFDLDVPIPLDAETTLYGPAAPTAQPVTWDGTTLTIPLSSYLKIDTIDENTNAETYYIIESSGQLVAHLVPEPSTMMLAGFGIAGLLSYGLRKRRSRVA